MSHMTSRDAEQLISQVMQITRSVALAEMASGIAHELNQPLGAIATFAQAGARMLDRPQPMLRQAIEVFQQINQEALNAGEGIRRIRRLFDQDDSAPESIPMRTLIGELAPVLDILSKHYAGEVRLDLHGDAHVRIDRAKIQHVLFALVQNAFEACHGGAQAPVVTIQVTCDRYQVETSVLDRGPGIPGGSEARLFRPFYTTKPRGTGLGLASSRAILEAHGGSIGFENQAHGGCRFWFRVPVAAAPEDS
jgi:two-component system sensor kinase FixL